MKVDSTLKIMDGRCSPRVRLRNTSELDLEFVLSLERDAAGKGFVKRWDSPRHRAALDDATMSHLIVESVDSGEPVGFILLAGIESADQNVEFMRIVIGPKNRGYGRSAVQEIKRHVFDDLQAHRLWLDVKEFNLPARALYRSEGFVEEGTLRECVKTVDGYESLVVMSLLASER